MTTIFRLDASIRTEGSVTRALATTMEQSLLAEVDEATVVRRDIGRHPLPSTTWADSTLGGWVPAEGRSPEQTAAIAKATELADEVLSADAYILAVPFYNFGVSQHFKAWVDILLTEPRFAPGGEQLLAGRPAYLIVARGGAYGPGTPRDGWDHATAWLTRILVDVWGLDVHLIESELTLADVNPAMESLRGLAAQNLAFAHDAADEHGRLLADKLGVTQAA